MNPPYPRPLSRHLASGTGSILCLPTTRALVITAVFLAGGAANAVTIDWVTVGDIGITNGGVGYQYRIGKYEVTIQQYTDFLNAAAKTDPYGLWNASMGTQMAVAGISRTGVSGSYAYSVMNNEGNSSNRPITLVSWFDVARFANWMHNGQGSGSTETGAYTLNGVTSGSTVSLNPGAKLSIPTSSEWVKAAYFSPLLNSGSGGYYTYATQSNAAPGNTIGGGSNQANYFTGVYSVTQSSGFSSSTSYLTDVGAFTGSASYYGTFDQSGNVSEWNSPTVASFNGGIRGGSWAHSASSLSISVSGFTDPSVESSHTGFRLASPVPVPEPSTWVMGAGGLACAAWGAWRRRRKHRHRGPSFVTAASLALVGSFLASGPARAVTIDWVTVGDPGNTADNTGYGAVADSFRIMKFEFTNSQYVAFLNAIDPDGTNPNAIYSLSMGSQARGGISFTSENGAGTKYAVKTNMGDKPVNYVNWWDAARVSNWLHKGAQTYGSTNSSASAPQNSGAYSVGTATSGSTVAKTSGALFYIPTEDEWYKAAYYNPTLNDGVGGYRLYGNGFDSTPTPVTASETGEGLAGSTGNLANYVSAADWNSMDGNVTTVGTNGGASYYGAFDFSGNVWELNDLTGSGGELSIGERGGGYFSGSINLESSYRFTNSSGFNVSHFGFRLASPVAVPEPSTMVMGLAGIACAGWGARRRRKRRHSRHAVVAAAVNEVGVTSSGVSV